MENSVTAEAIIAYRVSMIERNTETVQFVSNVSMAVGVTAAIAYGTTFWGVVITWFWWMLGTSVLMSVFFGVLYTIIDYYVERKLSK
jgi:fatty acid desaturase